ncbi:MAG: hypothetical protein AAFP77_12655 [Bacteroidota bacterium]
MRLVFLFSFMLLLLFSCANQENNGTNEQAAEGLPPLAQSVEEDALGTVNITVTGSKAGIAAFKRGLLLLHSFEYDDARTAFQEAQAADSTMVMAYWGEAMTHNHPLWRQQEIEDALTVLNRLAPTKAERLALAATPLERDFLSALEQLYAPEGTKQERDQAYSSYLAKMKAKYPDQQEVAAFYALSVLGAVPVGRDEAAYEKAARIAQGVTAENPNHPGALHYLIHAYDDPSHAPKAVPAANSYSRVAPAAAHALHMPSHIYVSMGMWEDVVSSNIASWDASVARMERKELDDNTRSYHALHWLMYGLTQQGRYNEAKKIMGDLKKYTATEPNRPARSYMVTMLANYLVETEDWDNGAVWSMSADREDLNILTRGIYHFAEGWRAYKQKDQEALATTIQAMADERKDAANQVTASGVPMCSAAGSNRSLPNQLDIDQARVMALELEAMQAQLQGDLIKTEKLLTEATGLEQKLSYAYGPPRIVMPSYELYGRWLLEQGRPTEAMQQFEYALAKGPGRLHALAGAWQAAEATKNQSRADELAELLRENIQGGDTEVKARFMPNNLLSAI